MINQRNTQTHASYRTRDAAAGQLPEASAPPVRPPRQTALLAVRVTVARDSTLGSTPGIEMWGQIGVWDGMICSGTQ